MIHTRQGRESARKLIADVQKFCSKHNITAAEIKAETGYQNSGYLLAGKLATVSVDTEERLRAWLLHRHALLAGTPVVQHTPEPLDGAAPAAPLTLSVPIRVVDAPELDMMQALAFVMDHFRGRLTPAADARALAWLTARAAS